MLKDGGLVGDRVLASFVDGLASIANVVTLGANVLATATIQELILSLLNGLRLERLESPGGIGLLCPLLFAPNTSRLGAVGLLARHFG